MRTRSRQTALPAYIKTGRSCSYDVRFPERPKVWSDVYVEVLANCRHSEVLQCQDELHPGPPYKSGGPFNIWRGTQVSYDLQGVGYYEGISFPNAVVYEGGFVLQANGPLLTRYLCQNYGSTSVYWPSFADVSSYGATGWKMYQPIKPTVDLGQTAYEIRELPRMLQTTAKNFRDLFNTYRKLPGIKKSAKELGDAWLNTQFGWKPFLSDMRKLITLQEKLEKQYAHLKAYNGKWHRRGGPVVRSKPVTSVDSSTTLIVLPTINNTLYHGIKSNTIVTDDFECWFEGRFRYWIPDLEPFDKWRKDYVHRLGLGITPTLLYDLTPWSWLIDWFTNLGDIVENISNYGQCVAKYAYVMGQSSRNLIFDATLQNFGGKNVNMTWKARLERKQRVVANPFGFGLQWSSLSPLQWSILGALGLGRLH